MLSFAGRQRAENSAFASKMLCRVGQDTAVGVLTQMEQGLSSLACSAKCSQCVQLVTGINSGDLCKKKKTGLLERLA